MRTSANAGTKAVGECGSLLMRFSCVFGGGSPKGAEETVKQC